MEGRDAFLQISFYPLFVIIPCIVISILAGAGNDMKLRQTVEYEPELYRNFTPVYITALLINTGNISRISDLLKYWGNDFKMLSPKSVFTIGSSESFPIFPDITIVTENRQVSTPMQYHYAFEDHLKHFLKKTKYRWFIRTTEDSFTHLKRLPGFIAELEAKYNPLTDIVFEGQAVDLAVGMFIHGGAGWIMSRAAASYYWKNRETIHNLWLEKGHGDDVMPWFFRDTIQWDTEKMRNEAFVGSPVTPRGVKKLMTRNYDDISDCPSVEWQTLQKRPIMRLNKTVFWHSSAQMLWTLTDGYRILEEASDLALGHITGSVELCRPVGTLSLQPSDQRLWT